MINPTVITNQRPFAQPQQGTINNSSSLSSSSSQISQSTRGIKKLKRSISKDPPSYEQIYQQSIVNNNNQLFQLQSQQERANFKILLKQFYRHARTISKFGLTGMKESDYLTKANQEQERQQSLNNRRSIRENDLICSSTVGILKPCRSCVEGERCNQLGNPRCKPSRQLTQYTLSYSFSPEQQSQIIEERELFI